MILGQFRDGFPRIVLELPLLDGGSRKIQFIVDSGFEADLALPPSVIDVLDATYVGDIPISLADLTFRTRPVYRLFLNWQGEDRITEVISMEGNPLLGVGVLLGNQVLMDMTEGGDVTVETL